MVYAANVAEDDLAAPDANKHVVALRQKAEEEGSGVVVVSAQVRLVVDRAGLSLQG
jgi:ribosome-binding ATPase YchF (GTP1/OBG family)